MANMPINKLLNLPGLPRKTEEYKRLVASAFRASGGDDHSLRHHRPEIIQMKEHIFYKNNDNLQFIKFVLNSKIIFPNVFFVCQSRDLGIFAFTFSRIPLTLILARKYFFAHIKFKTKTTQYPVKNEYEKNCHPTQ